MQQMITLNNFSKLTDAQKEQIRLREELHAKSNSLLMALMSPQEKAEFEALRMRINDIKKEDAKPVFDQVFEKDGKLIN